MNNWTEWSCDRTTGQKTRTRTTIQPELNGGATCGPIKDIQSCERDCTMSTYSPTWSPCEEPGIRKKTRDIIINSSNGGITCGPQITTTPCNSQVIHSLYAYLDNGIQKSTNASSWSSISTTANTIDYSGTTRAIVVNNLFFKTEYNLLYRSTDNGINWSQISFTNMTIYNIYDIKYNNEYFIASGDNGIIVKSVDGYTWSQHVVTPGFRYKITNLGWNGTTWLATLFEPVLGMRTSTSLNGETWTNLTSLGATSYNPSSYPGDIHYFKNNWLIITGSSAVSFSGKIIKSSDNGVTWSVLHISSYPLSKMSSNDTNLVIISTLGDIYVTNDLINYSSQNYYFQFSGFGGIRDIITFRNSFYIFGSNNGSSMIYKSDTGNNFTLVTTFSNTVANSLVYS
jgi:hypothetical protein